MIDQPTRRSNKWSSLFEYLVPFRWKLFQFRGHAEEYRNSARAVTITRRGSYDHDLILQLPNELLLRIASFLDVETQLLLSLSCQQLRILLGTHLDLALTDDRAAKVRFLQLLELDHPEYLTCRACALLYSWRKRQRFRYSCPRKDSHTIADIQLSCRQFVYQGSKKNIDMERPVVDLILRASEHGPQYGLPVSFLNTSGYDSRGFFQIVEARIINAELLLANRVEAEIGLDHAMEMIRRITLPDVCLHLQCTYGIIQSTWKAVEQALADMKLDSVKDEIFKCPFCETDHQLRLVKNNAERIRVEFIVWRNYGRKYTSRLINEQIFHRYPMLQLSSGAVSQRDVQALFES